MSSVNSINQISSKIIPIYKIFLNGNKRIYCFSAAYKIS